MDFECWESRNLARCVLSESFRRAVYHMTEDEHSSNSEDNCEQRRTTPRGRLLAREQMIRLTKASNPRFQSEGRHVPHYRRFARSVSLDVFSSTSSSGDEYLRRPVYRRFSRSVASEEGKSPIVIWPASGRMNAFLGKVKIEEFIRKTWSFSERIKYSIDFRCIIRLKGVDRYKYSSIWSNGFFSSRIYFTIDASSEDDYRPVSMSYSLPDGKRLHRLDSAVTSVQHFLRHLDPTNNRNHRSYNS